jgi:hypothetical protein
VFIKATDLKIASKTVIIHDDSETFSIISMLSNNELRMDRPPMGYLNIEHKDFDLNIFECSKVYFFITLIFTIMICLI